MKLDIQLLDSKGELIRNVTQWDINRAIRIQGLHLSDAPVIRLSNANSEEAVLVQSEIKDNIVEFVIPNEFLHTPIINAVGNTNTGTFDSELTTWLCCNKFIFVPASRYSALISTFSTGSTEFEYEHFH